MCTLSAWPPAFTQRKARALCCSHSAVSRSASLLQFPYTLECPKQEHTPAGPRQESCFSPWWWHLRMGGGCRGTLLLERELLLCLPRSSQDKTHSNAYFQEKASSTSQNWAFPPFFLAILSLCHLLCVHSASVRLIRLLSSPVGKACASLPIWVYPSV